MQQPLKTIDAPNGAGVYLSISELTVMLNQALEREFPEVLFSGEISEVTLARSGHLYFCVKDSTSQLSAVMWAGMVSALKFKVEPGLSVQCHGKPNIYRGNGRFQIVVHRMTPAGEGALRKKFLELKAKLEREGFFAKHRKRPLPFLPRAVGIVTSKSGAALHDIMVRIRERMPSLPVYLADCKVQGDGAAQQIVSGIECLDKSKLVDVIIVARGGGSLEDLWAFNEEIVVKAIFASSTPIVSGVGHEVDISLSDLAADVRAPTPTAAAEIVVPHRVELMRRIAEYERRLNDTDRWFLPLIQQLDDLSLRLDHKVSGFVEAALLKIKASAAKLRGIEPMNLIRLFSQRLEGLEKRMTVSLAASHQRRLARVDAVAAKLEAVNPRRVLERGFSIVEAHGEIIRSSASIQAKESISITFAEGAASATVNETRKR